MPKPKTEASVPAPVSSEVPSTAESPREAVVADSDAASAKAPAAMHQLMPSVPVKPVVVGKEASAPVAARPIQEVPAAKSASKVAPAKTTKDKRELTASRKSGKDAKAKDVRVNRPRLDLSLPPELVKELAPPANVITAKRKPILPQMFQSKESSDPFELNGRLLSNEMQLQMRNESRREVEGAALDFKFKQ